MLREQGTGKPEGWADVAELRDLAGGGERAHWDGHGRLSHWMGAVGVFWQSSDLVGVGLQSEQPKSLYRED